MNALKKKWRRLTIYEGILEWGQTFIHRSEFRLTARVGSLPTTGALSLEFRLLNGTNKNRVNIQTSGVLTLDGVVNNVTTVLGTSSIAAGQTLMIEMFEGVLKVYKDSTLLIQTTPPEVEYTSGALQTVNGGTLIDFTIWYYA